MADAPENRADLKDLMRRIDSFAQERDWEQFHTPKNLTMALTVEAAELLEIFQWLPDSQRVQEMSEANRKAVEHEVADIMTYLLRFCSVANIDPLAAVEEKLLLNAKKYPVDLVRGKSNKYTDYQ